MPETRNLDTATLGQMWRNLSCRKASRAKFWRNVSPTWAKNVAKFGEKISPIFILQFPGEVAARNFTKNWQQIRLSVTKFLHRETLGAWGHKILIFSKAEGVDEVCCAAAKFVAKFRACFAHISSTRNLPPTLHRKFHHGFV